MRLQSAEVTPVSRTAIRRGFPSLRGLRFRREKFCADAGLNVPPWYRGIIGYLSAGRVQIQARLMIGFFPPSDGESIRPGIEEAAGLVAPLNGLSDTPIAARDGGFDPRDVEIAEFEAY